MNELKVNKSLLTNNFDTYKLSLENLGTSKETIPEGVRIKHPNDEQFSFLHHREFSLHNHLYEDIRNNDVYLITSEGKVKRVLINYQTEKVLGLMDVWTIPDHSHCKGGNFNASIDFPSSELAVITDGCGFLYIIDTSNRKDITHWKTLFAEEVLGDKREFKVACSRLQDKDTSSSRKLHCVLLLIEASETHLTHIKTAGFETVLKWMIFTEGNNTWEMSLVNTLRGKGSTDYVFLELGCQALYFISDSEFYSTQIAKNEEQSNQQCDRFAEPDYHWEQTNEEIKLWLHIASCSEKSQLKIETASNSVNVCWKDTLQLSGTLFGRIDPTLTTWSFSNSKLEIVMQKEEVGIVWTSLLTDNTKYGKEIFNEEFVAEIHTKLEHLCSESEDQGDAAMLNSGDLEECDAFGESRFLRRFHLKSGSVTHKMPLGSEQWLFLVKFDGAKLPAFCMRRDVDGLVWQPSTEADIFHCTHIHTFPAFGYIAASRQDKKFLVAPPSLSYVAIINTVGHVIVFRKTNLSGDSVLRNRKTSVTTKSLYVQNLVKLDSNCQAVGAVASHQFLYVLTTNDIIMINLN